MYKLKYSEKGGEGKSAAGILLRQFASTINVIRRRYSLLEVPRRRIHNVIALAMSISICVAYGNKVVDTCRPQPAGCGGKYDIQNGVQCGRSMIEMLGVLAIIAVLSVGGIAGYSKTMEKFKINRIVDEYNMLIRGLMEYEPNLRETNDNINNLVLSLNLVPNVWKIESGYLTDRYGNKMRIGYRSADNDRQWDTPEKSGVYIDYFLGTLGKNEQGVLRSESFSDKICYELFSNVIKPLHNVVNAGWVNSGVSYYYNSFYYGDNYCSGNRKCLKDITLDTIKIICSSCDKIKHCNVTVIF